MHNKSNRIVTKKKHRNEQKRRMGVETGEEEDPTKLWAICTVMNRRREGSQSSSWTAAMVAGELCLDASQTQTHTALTHTDMRLRDRSRSGPRQWGSREQNAKPAAFPRVRFLLNNFRNRQYRIYWRSKESSIRKMKMKSVWIVLRFSVKEATKFTALGFVFVCKWTYTHRHRQLVLFCCVSLVCGRANHHTRRTGWGRFN